MKEKKSPVNKEQGRYARPDTRDHRPQERNGGRTMKDRHNNTKPPHRLTINKLANSKKAGADPSVLDGNLAIDCVDDGIRIPKVDDKQRNEKPHEIFSDMEIADGSNAESTKDSVCSPADSETGDDERAEKAEPLSVKPHKIKSANAHALRSKSENQSSEVQAEVSNETPKGGTKDEIMEILNLASNISIGGSRNVKIHSKPSSDFSEEDDGRLIEHNSQIGSLDEAPYGSISVSSDEEAVNTDKINSSILDQKTEEIENRIQDLESELREVAALEISLYSVVPEHGSSAHKVHTPARRLFRLYIYACKHWSQNKRAYVARNTVSGLVTISKSCGNDVSRLTFWLSNTVVLREIISQAFGRSCQSNALTKMLESGGGKIRSSQHKPKNNIGSRKLKNQSFIQLDDWQETRTFICALEKVESWIFSRIVESIWWQTLAPNMQSPTADNSMSIKGAEKLWAPSLGDQRQGSFSVNLWNSAFHDSFKRLCPVRAGGHECGCLSVLARKVMEQCVGRLDVAMFNAILRESSQEIPTDPVSDPILESKVLPILAGDLSFGSGAQLKNAVGNWTRWLSDFLDMDAESYAQDGKNGFDDVDDPMINGEHKSFSLLNSLSDLLMLPKDMLMERTIRLEACSLISLPLVKRILCNFSPDEFCPDPVPGVVLEAINAECIEERRITGDSASSFPFPASPVVYSPAWSSGENTRSSAMHRKGYTSDDELDELECCLGSVSLHSSSYHNRRYDLLREVWRAT